MLYEVITQLQAKLAFPELVLQRGPVVLTSSGQTPLEFSTRGTAETLDFTLDNLTLTSPIPVQTRISGTFTPADRTLQGSATVGSALLEQDAAINFFGVFGSDHSELDLTLTGEKQQSTRITSYNVCYTKLLRECTPLWRRLVRRS